MSVVDRAKGWLAAVMRSRPYRANERFGQSRGALVSAGIAFFGVFAIFPLLVIGVAVLGLVAPSGSDLQQSVIAAVQGAVPGLVAPGDGDGAIVNEQQLQDAADNRFALGLSAAVGAVTLLLTGLGWMAALREGIRSVFRLPVMALDPVRAKLFDLGVLATLGLLIVVSALSAVVTQSVSEQLLRALGLDGSGIATVVLPAVVLAATVAADTVLFAVLYKVLANSREPLRRVLGGALLAAVGVAVLRYFFSQLISNVGGGFSFLAPFVGLLALFVWLNLNARVMLLGAAWVAVGPTPAAQPGPAPERAGDPTPVPAHAPLPPALPVRWADRAVLGAGVVLGASAVAIVQASGSAIKALLTPVRPRDDG